MELILVRHAAAESQESIDGTPADPSLSSRGRAQADAVAAWLAAEGVDAIVSSPSRRARETAAPTARRASLDVVVDSRLAEIDPDAKRYRSIEDDRDRDHDAYQKRIAAYQSDPRMAAATLRVEEALVDWARRYPSRRIAVFCHGGVVTVWTRTVLGLGPEQLFHVDNASAHRFLVSREGVRSVKSLNETAYLV